MLGRLWQHQGKEIEKRWNVSAQERKSNGIIILSTVDFTLNVLHHRIYATIRKSEGSGKLKLKCKGVNLKNVEGFFGTSDPFYELSRKAEGAGGQTWYVHVVGEYPPCFLQKI